MRAAILALLAGPVAAGTFTPPQGCTAFLTVQNRGCIVEHLWTCTADGPGLQWRGEIDQRGLVYVGQIDVEAQWVQSFFLTSGDREALISPAPDPASFSTLLQSGLDTYDFSLDTGEGPHRVVGFDRIAERDVVIDGERLHRTEYSIRKTDADGELIYEAEGSEYVSETHGRFFSGTGDVTRPDTTFSYDSRPVDFIYPGQGGFLSDTPLYGCDALAAGYVTE
ncbi:hypothetical protein BOO69_00340 [Sulfitobacter alexandrii]|uniref:Uncharacterized protein n=1 Tax=Sulfitobacter alexandrii TaxID=1917485 RepID=A0A1J0WCJ1_9RHOB|nr:hypothetical protein [Sulfitobacter alexandrii]APE42028.1 hypothetical protein BOO69_00340 [Sulfitobacter alexandrii]